MSGSCLYCLIHANSFVNPAQNDGIEFWTHPNGINSSVDIMASPDEKDGLQDFLASHGIPTKRIMHNVGKVIEQTSVQGQQETDIRQFNGNQTSRGFFSTFQSYKAIEGRINQLASSPLVKAEVVGYSTEGRPLYLVKVSRNHEANKPVIFIDAGHHAREVSDPRPAS